MVRPHRCISLPIDLSILLTVHTVIFVIYRFRETHASRYNGGSPQDPRYHIAAMNEFFLQRILHFGLPMMPKGPSLSSYCTIDQCRNSGPPDMW